MRWAVTASAYAFDPELAQALRTRCAGRGIAFILSARTRPLDSDHPTARLLASNSGREGLVVADELLIFDRALACVADHASRHQDWCTSRTSSSWSTDDVEAGGALSELEAFGTLLEIFPECAPTVPRREQTPDFAVPGAFALEVYRPRESTTNRDAVAADLAAQTGMVRIAVSYPITGPGEGSLAYPASKVVDRIVNAKRTSRQIDPHLPNILYVDARHEWGLATEDLLPFRTTYSQGEHWIGTFGAWHAFYGVLGKRTMLRDRAALRYLRRCDAHEQKRNGLFREADHWSAALLAVRDGLVLFENPWARRRLDEATVRALLQLHRLRPECSWYCAGRSRQDLERDIEQTLARMEWSFRGNNEEGEQPAQAGTGD